MAGFLYYLPRFQGTPTVKAIQDLGLAYAFDCKSCVAMPTFKGPDNSGGQIVVHERFNAERLGFYHDTQTWRKMAGRDIWVGMYNQERPRPADLARADQISGRLSELADGNEWILPQARRWDEFGENLLWQYNLPTRFDLDDQGRWTAGSVVPRYERLWQLAMAYESAYYQALSARESVEPGEHVEIAFTPADLHELVIECLRVNYRVGPDEIAMLGVYDSQLQRRAVRVLLDDDTQLEWLKKKQTETVANTTLAEAGQDGSTSSYGHMP